MIESRAEIKQRVRDTLEDAQVSPKAMVAMYLGLSLLLRLMSNFPLGGDFLLLLLPILTSLLSMVLDAGFVLYCMMVRRGQRAEYLVLFDGFELSLKIILLEIAKAFFVFLWSLLFILPGIVAAYRYSFALFNLLENPNLGVMDALNMSKRQTWGWKGRLFMLDLSYIPWILLAGIPQYIYNGAIQRQVRLHLGDFTSYAGGNYGHLWQDALESVNGTAFGISSMGWQVIIGAWALVVGIFYLAHYQCVVLEYFEAAKRECGVGEGSAPWEREDFYNLP